MTTNNADDMKPMTADELEELDAKIRTFLGIDKDAEPHEILNDLVARLMHEKSHAERRAEIHLVKRMELEAEVKMLRKKNKLRKKHKKLKAELKGALKEVMATT